MKNTIYLLLISINLLISCNEKKETETFSKSTYFDYYNSDDPTNWRN
jgi:major membrane immunogen (membrane-anchored lipoprotein)